MKKRIVRVIAALTVMATAGLSLELIGGDAIIAAAAGTTSISVGCSGATGDNAGSVSGAPKSTADLVALLAATGGPSSISIPVNVTANVPDKVKKGSGAFAASFDYGISLPPSLAGQVKTLLHQTAIQIVNASFNVTYSGAETGTLPTTNIASQTIDLNGSGSTSVHIAGTVPSDTSGHLTFKPGTFNIGVAVNGSVAGVATIGTLSLICGSNSPIGATSIQVPGAPDTPGTITANPIVGGTLGITPILGRSDITPDDGNPILPDTLAVVDGANGAYVKNGALVQPSPNVGGVLDTTLQLCAPSRPVPAVPGTDQVQKLIWPTQYPTTAPSPHPSAMTLSFGDQTTAPIPLSNGYQYGPTVDALAGVFQAPSAATIQAALTALPNIGANNIKVTDITGGYSIEWVGAKADMPLPIISLASWTTVPFDFAGYGAIQAAIAKLTAPTTTTSAPPGVTTTTDPGSYDGTVAQLQAALLAGTITPDQFSAKFGSALTNSITQGVDITAVLAGLKQIFPQPPDLSSIATDGVLTIPATETGPLCSQFTVETQSVSLAFLAFLDRLLHPLAVKGCVTTRVRVKVKVHSHPTRYATRLVSKTTCPKKVVKKSTKKKVVKKSTKK